MELPEGKNTSMKMQNCQSKIPHRKGKKGSKVNYEES